MNFRDVVVPLTFVLVVLAAVELLAADIPRSVAERSGYTRTATEAELAEIVEATAAADDRIELTTIGKSHEGRPIRALYIGFGGDDDANDSRQTVCIIGGIHSGECAGKEAMCDLTRRIANGQHADWFETMRLIIVPSLSPDSNVRRSIDNRPGQVGPVAGMGRRANGQGLDLNRDFLKLESPEISALVATMTEHDVDLLIDLHTTNGSRHRYELTYDPPHHPITPPAIRSFLRKDCLPVVTGAAAERGFSMFYYGNFDRAHTRWSTFGYEGRYSTNYMGVRGKLGLLAEAYSYASYPDRIGASDAFVVASLDHIHQNAATATKILGTPHHPDPIPVSARRTAFDEPVTVRGYSPGTDSPSQETVPVDHRVRFFGDFEPVDLVARPTGYLVPRSETRVLDLLAKHGIETQPSADSSEGTIESFVVEAFRQAERAFQGHRMVRVDGEWSESDPGELPPTVFVPIDQPLGGVVAVLLEPQSVDSVVTWNVIDPDRLGEGTTYPILRLSPRLSP